MAEIIELILTYERIGDGTKKDPVRLVTQLFTKKGKLVASFDPTTQDQYFFASEVDPFQRTGEYE